jgi:hypothetical protein
VSLSINIDKLLETDEAVFENIVKRLFVENLNSSKKELEEKYKFNHKLYDAIEFTLKKLKEEESLISRVLYKSFGVGKKKNKRRRELILLGTKFKYEIDMLRKNIQKIDSYNKSCLSSIEALTELSQLFGKKVYTIEEDELADRCNRYLRKVYIATDRVDRVKRELELKSIFLESTLDKYRKLFYKIPRYHELDKRKRLEYKR